MFAKQKKANLKRSITQSGSDGYKPEVVPKALRVIHSRLEAEYEEELRVSNVVLEGIPADREAARIKGLMIVEVPVSNMQRAIEFYVGQLGFYLDVKKNPLPIAPDNREVFIYPAEGIKIMLWQTEGNERLGFTRDGKPHQFLILEIVEPADVVRNKLIANGVKVGEIVDRGGCGIVFNVWDSDGNILQLNYQQS